MPASRLRFVGSAVFDSVFSATIRSRALELRLPGTVLDERVHPDGPVLGREQSGELLPLDPQARLQVDLESRSMASLAARRAYGGPPANWPAHSTAAW